MRVLQRAACALLATLVFGAASAAYPDKPVRMIVPLPPGGSADLVARMIATKLSASLGQQVIVDNRPGATGNIGAEAVVRSPADGYTLLFGTSAYTITPHLQKVPYDLAKDLAPITQPNLTPYVLAVNAGTPYRNLQEFLAAAKRKPINYGSYGVGSPTHLAMALMASKAGVTLNHVPYKGSAPMLTDLVGGQIEAVFDLPSNLMPFVRSGKLRLLATGTRKPLTIFPDVPTVASAVPGFESVGWQGIFAPAGTPRPIIDVLHREIVKALRQPDVRDRLLELGFEPYGSTPAEFAGQIQDDLAKWGKVIKDNDIKPEN